MKDHEEVHEDNNKIWVHAQSAESIMKRQELEAQLEYMRELFMEKLPIGDKKDHIMNYFNDIERVISTKEQYVEYERFDDDDSCPKDRQYIYNSATLFKERSKCDGGHIPIREGVEHTTDVTGTGTTVQDQSEIVELV